MRYPANTRDCENVVWTWINMRYPANIRDSENVIWTWINAVNIQGILAISTSDGWRKWCMYMNECMTVGMNEIIWVYKWMNVWMNIWMNECLDECMNLCIKEWMNESDDCLKLYRHHSHTTTTPPLHPKKMKEKKKSPVCPFIIAIFLFVCEPCILPTSTLHCSLINLQN